MVGLDTDIWRLDGQFYRDRVEPCSREPEARGSGEYSSTGGEYSSTSGEYSSTGGEYSSTGGEYSSPDAAVVAMGRVSRVVPWCFSRCFEQRAPHRWALRWVHTVC
eukprot:862725-Prorocentrum_minimum.AAC.1